MALIKVSDDLFLNTDEGILVSRDIVAFELKKELAEDRGFKVNENVDIDISCDNEQVKFYLKSGNRASNGQGFLVEVFFSGSDGKLTKVYSQAKQSYLRGQNDIDLLINYLQVYGS